MAALSSRLLCLHLAAFAALGTAPAFSAEKDAPSAWSVDYSRWPDGQAYGKSEAKRDWPTLAWFDEPGDGHIREFPDGSGRHWLEVGFPAGTFGGGAHGTKFAAELAPRDSYTLEYDVHFPADWEFSKNNELAYGGGKLPGLSGGSHPSGGNGKPDGMSARPMWRRDTRFSEKPQNYLELYLYWQHQTEKYGDRFFAQAVEAGRMAQNSPPNSRRATATRSNTTCTFPPTGNSARTTRFPTAAENCRGSAAARIPRAATASPTA